MGLIMYKLHTEKVGKITYITGFHIENRQALENDPTEHDNHPGINVLDENLKPQYAIINGKITLKKQTPSAEELEAKRQQWVKDKIATKYRVDQEIALLRRQALGEVNLGWDDYLQFVNSVIEESKKVKL